MKPDLHAPSSWVLALKSAAKAVRQALSLTIAILNPKNLPGFWHFRVLRGMYYQLYWQPNVLQPEDLFRPLVTSSTNTLYDCDWNLHKSNSTYFADLDVARTHLMSCVLRAGLRKLDKGGEAELPPSVANISSKCVPVLAGVACSFHREIEPLQPFETYTRVLCWDHRSIYCISHIVEKGSLQPRKFVLQPDKTVLEAHDPKQAERNAVGHVFASSIARYVIKKGRATISPELVLRRSDLLPQNPENDDGLNASNSSTGVFTSPVDSGRLYSKLLGTQVGAGTDSFSTSEASTDGAWTWDDMEGQRLRGLQLAKHFEALGAARDELIGEEVLGHYGNYW